VKFTEFILNVVFNKKHNAPPFSKQAQFKKLQLDIIMASPMFSIKNAPPLFGLLMFANEEFNKDNSLHLPIKATPPYTSEFPMVIFNTTTKFKDNDDFSDIFRYISPQTELDDVYK
jgi:hypothetical protein